MALAIRYKIYQFFDAGTGKLIRDPYFDHNWPDGFDTMEHAMAAPDKEGILEKEYTILPSITTV